MNAGRREFVGAAVAAGLAGTVGGVWTVSAHAADENPVARGKTDEEVSPGEDLMHEHGLLKRILLIYGEGIGVWRRKKTCRPRPSPTRRRSSGPSSRTTMRARGSPSLPAFPQGRKLVGLVDVLKAQQKAGRKLADVTQRLAAPRSLKSDEKRRLVASCNSSSACTTRTKRGRTRSYSRPSTKS